MGVEGKDVFEKILKVSGIHLVRKGTGICGRKDGTTRKSETARNAPSGSLLVSNRLGGWSATEYSRSCLKPLTNLS